MNLTQANLEIKKLTIEIMHLCLEINDTGNDSFFRYSGHVNWFSVEINNGKWEEDKKKLYTSEDIKTFLSIDFDEDDMEVINFNLNKIKKVKGELEKILNKNTPQ